MGNQNPQLEVGVDVITSKGLFGKVTKIEGDRIYVKLGSKEVPIFRNQLNVSLGKMNFYVTYTIEGDDTEYPACVILNKHTIVYSDTIRLENLIKDELFKQTAKRINLVSISIA